MEGKKGDNMKITLGSFEISISAKYKWQHRQNKETTLLFLNYLSVIFSEASENYEHEGYDHLAKTTGNIRDELYKICNDNGLYKE